MNRFQEATLKIRARDIRLIDELFGMEGGYVLNFSNKTFAEFFDDEIGVDIDEPHFANEGDSKAKRLRYFLKISELETVLITLRALWDYRSDDLRRRQADDRVPAAKEEFERLLDRLRGAAETATNPEEQQGSLTVPLKRAVHVLRGDLEKLNALEPQGRGYAFERFLKSLFDTFGLEARSAFKLVGEQIDGSFQLGSDTYLLEAKWTATKIGSADLRSFNAKVEDKASWARGLFVSYSGFSEDGLQAFGTGKSTICMDGLDIHDLLKDGRHLGDVLSGKARRAVETGASFVRVRELF